MDLSGLNFNNAKLENVLFDNANGKGFVLDYISRENSTFDDATRKVF